MEETPKTQGNKALPIIIVVALVAAYFVFNGVFGQSAAEKRAEQMFEKETGGSADIDFDGESRFEFETEEGKVVIDQQGGLPEDFPTDIQLYPNAEVTGYVSMDSEDVNGYNTTLSTTDSQDDVYNFYLTSLEADGWNVISQLSADSYSSVGAEKDTRTMVASITSDGENTVVVLTVKNE